MKIVFCALSSSKVDRFTSNQDHNDHRPILQISPNITHQRKSFDFVIIVSNYPGEPHIASATGPCTHL